MRRASIVTAVISVLLSTFSSHAFATDLSFGDRYSHIQAERMALDYNGRAVIFTGHPKLVVGDCSVSSDVLRIIYGTDFRDVRSVVATGRVRIAQGSRWATSDEAVLNNRDHTVILTGSPTVHDDGQAIRGRKITIHLSAPSAGPGSPEWNDLPPPQRILAAE